MPKWACSSLVERYVDIVGVEDFTPLNHNTYLTFRFNLR